MNFDEQHWIRVLQQLVRLPSPFEHEHAVVAEVESLLRQFAGVEIHRVSHDPARLAQLPGAVRPFSAVPDRHSLVARVRGTGGGRSLVLSAHLDTAPEGDPAAWTRPPYSGDFDATTGRVCGRGAMDDKAGVTVLLAVLDAVLRDPGKLRGDLLFHFVLEDETTGNGTLLCLDAGYRADAAFIVDGTRLDRAIRAHAGQLEFTVTIAGRPASVSVSHLGTNAADAAARLALELREFVQAMNAIRPEAWRCFPSPYQCSLQALHSDGGAFTTPELATAKFFLTFCPPDSLAAMRTRIEGFLADFSLRHALPAAPRITWDGFAAEPVASPPSELDQLLMVAGIVPGPSTGTSDLRHFVGAGIPCLLYGPGGGGNPHRPDEFYPVADLATMTRFYVEAAQAWCGSGHKS